MTISFCHVCLNYFATSHVTFAQESCPIRQYNSRLAAEGGALCATARIIGHHVGSKDCFERQKKIISQEERGSTPPGSDQQGGGGQTPPLGPLSSVFFIIDFVPYKIFAALDEEGGGDLTPAEVDGVV